ncbi:hypothetical protein D7W82_04000 [Corallococcus sp. CA049B]|uniref:hypothetical protein n=1 Tax=unclassified Corallococcus TaxID=2685029 RepID=UPI000EA061F4|nr:MULTISPECIES: hypothetical protein [unclassified Corallococcus]MCY1033214.1 hypothetical protein [Corallococcus sp. BB11-1]RKG90462.1 hypothetical protein D7W82_04000 [Corallococcus sp. CA049B]
MSSIEAYIEALEADRGRLFKALTEDPNWSEEPVHYHPQAYGGLRPSVPLNSLTPQERDRVRRCRDSRLWLPAPAGTVQDPSGVVWVSPPVNPAKNV